MNIHLYTLNKIKKENPKNIVKFSLNLKSRQGGESQTVEFKRLTQ